MHDKNFAVSYQRFPLKNVLGSHFSAQLDGWNGAYKAVTAAQLTGCGWTGHFNHIFDHRPCFCVLCPYLHINCFLHSKTTDRGPGRASLPRGRICHQRKTWPWWCRAREATSWEAHLVSSHVFVYKCTDRPGDCLPLPRQAPLHLPAPAPGQNEKPWERCTREDSLKLSGKWIQTFMPPPVPKNPLCVFSIEQIIVPFERV